MSAMWVVFVMVGTQFVVLHMEIVQYFSGFDPSCLKAWVGQEVGPDEVLYSVDFLSLMTEFIAALTKYNQQ